MLLIFPFFIWKPLIASGPTHVTSQPSSRVAPSFFTPCQALSCLPCSGSHCFAFASRTTTNAHLHALKMTPHPLLIRLQMPHPLSIPSTSSQPPTSSTTAQSKPHPYRRRNQNTSPPPPPRPATAPPRPHQLFCSLSPAAQGRHSGSRDSEPLGHQY
jgi:hypothetical protein